MKIKLSSIFVNHQHEAQQFYTEKLGFVLKHNIPMGEHNWLTVTAADEPNGTELLLEPNANPASLAFQQAIYQQDIPATAFEVDDIAHEYERLQAMGVQFKAAPQAAGGVTIAILDDTCGNWIQLYQIG
jgi:catechol 2,3-dioxygenase-like lactoylglutathione lyase family enzyme